MDWRPAVVTQVFGNHPNLLGLPLTLLSSYFLWYPVSLYNYARLCGWLANDGDEKAARAYVEEVLPPPVLRYRNKVAAHFALADSRPDDTPADLAASVLLPVSFINGRLAARGFRITVVSDDGPSTSDDLMWSLTDVHEKLSERYGWPAPPPGNKASPGSGTNVQR